MPDNHSQDPKDSFLSADNIGFLENQYEDFLHTATDSDAINQNALNQYYKQLSVSDPASSETPHIPVREKFKGYMLSSHLLAGATSSGTAGEGSDHLYKHNAVRDLIEAYRQRGHQIANLDPLGRSISVEIIELTLKNHGLSEQDLETEFSFSNINEGKPTSLKNIIGLLRRVYCSHIGYEYNYIMDTSMKTWIQKEITSTKEPLSKEQKVHILDRITAAEGLEKYLHIKYTGQKRFSLEGGDSLIVALDAIVYDACDAGLKDMVIGMAHRGRLNVLINIFGKSPAELVSEFEGTNKAVDMTSSGDVKYHQGFASDVRCGDNVMHISLAFNPSHLQIVYPVVEGSVRARQDMRNDADGSQVIPVLIHGDAAFAGQGVNMETLNMVETRGYSTKGTIHIVVNNQIGFTTSNAKDSRSTYYCTDLAKMINAPIIHVNGDDPESVLRVAKMAVKFRNLFQHDVVIDLYCYRRHGHNEGDEPSVTQPQMYSVIKKLPTVRSIYSGKLIQEGVLSEKDCDVMVEQYRNILNDNKCAAKHITKVPKNSVTRARERYWQDLLKLKGEMPTGDTGFDGKQLKDTAIKLNTIPEGFTPHSRVKKILKDRIDMAEGKAMADWGFAENLAYATLLQENFGVRVSGQDCGRGTFFHRHAVLHDSVTGESILPLRQFQADKSKCLVIDSLLSEEAVLAFEYGYTTTNPSTLVVWEAQFGDFANGAQVVIDQFISSGQTKWNRLCSLVMLLPHGYEGQGPEHSSARLERYMQLCAEKNMMVATPTLPAQIFHLLRQQMKRATRKPLIVMAPKSGLRHPDAISSMDDLAEGQFESILDDPAMTAKSKRSKVTKIVLCCGKVFFDLNTTRNEQEMDKVAIIRIEQLYPFPLELKEILQTYPNAKQVVWCQEEPKNQGAWRSIRHRLEAVMSDAMPLDYIGREPSASTAVGYAKLHTMQQTKLVNDALST